MIPVLGLLAFGLLAGDAARAQDPHWIWSAAHEKDNVPAVECFFRKSFNLHGPEVGEIQISADNEYELFVNDQLVGRGNDWRQMQVYDISKYLREGRNCVAVKAKNTDVGPAGLVANVLVKENGKTMASYSTNRSWKTSVRQYQGWANPDFPENEWVNATSYGILNSTLPWGDEVVFEGEGSRFKIGEEFVVERIMQDSEVGSLIAMSFDAHGNLLVSQEGGPLKRIVDSDRNGSHDTVNVFAGQLKNVQGILAHGPYVFAIGSGPNGNALYRLHDTNNDGVAEEVKAIVPIIGSGGEHGAHAIRLGPDGLLYVVLGNHVRAGGPPSAPRSPYRNWYEGDLNKPRHEDPRGHAVGVPAPGGTIFRTDTEGSFVELVAGGMRNTYDFAFNTEGEIFTYDADMEWDLGASWYRPTRVSHSPAGAEMGWRSGWAKWPAYYLDSLPPSVNLGPGSPTGVEFYNHTAMPEQYRGAMFCCDWATGQIHCVKLKREGASYAATSEVFVEGRPLNVTDIAVGPDGAMYFTTGGRGTDGGVYRIRWTEHKPNTNVSTGIAAVLALPQLDAAWAKTKVMNVQRQLGPAWGQELNAVLQSTDRKIAERLQALDLLMAFGPTPPEQMLVKLTNDSAADLRIRAARSLFAHSTAGSRNALVGLMSDSDPFMRRVACETLTRLGAPVAAEKYIKLLDDPSLFVAFAARRALEQLPLDTWAGAVLAHSSPMVFCRGSVAILAVSPTPEAAQAILPRCEELFQQSRAENPTPEQNRLLLNLLRVTELALGQGKIAAQQVPALGAMLLAKYPSGNDAIDRELVQLLVYLQTPGAAEKFGKQMESEIADVEKIHLGAYGSRLKVGWTPAARHSFLLFYEVSRSVPGGYSVNGYLEKFAREFFSRLTPEETRKIITSGQKWPTSTLSMLASMKSAPDAALLAELRTLDKTIQPLCAKSDTYRRLRVSILATLGRSGEPASLEHLRAIYRDEPSQRSAVAMTLTQHPGGENWSYLVDSIKTVEGRVAQEVLIALKKVAERPQKPEPFRQVILLGLRLRNRGANHALNLLDHWAGQQSQNGNRDWERRLAGWQQWYAKHFPGAPPAELPVDSGKDKWSKDELLAFLKTASGKAGDPVRGKAAFKKAQCSKCHRCGGEGETVGPDLSTVAKRFQQQELLESIIYPSHNISDQYASKVVLSNGRAYAGMVLPRNEEGITVLLSDGEKVDLDHEDIDEIEESRLSVMPTGLLNKLSLSEVADLFAFLENRQEKPQQTQAAK